MALRRSHRSRAAEATEPEANMRTRSKRQTRAAASASASISVSRSPLNSEEPRTLRLTVKMPSNKLREATGSGRAAGRRSVNVFREDPIVSGPRSSRNRKKIVEVESSDDDEEIDDQEEDEVDDEDAPDDDEDADADADGDADADADADGDIDMDDTPPQPAIRRAKPAPSRAKPPKSVEAKEMEMEEDEEDEDEDPISDTDEDAEGEMDDQDEIAIADVNGDDLDDLDEEDELDEEMMDSDALAMHGEKTTKRQRGNLGNDFLQLPMEPQVKKHLTAEERQMRRAEMARRRKNLSEKRNEEEKMDTINRLLKKQAPKRRGRAAANDTGDGTPGQEVNEPEKADPTLVRWISSSKGCKVGVPEEWLGTPSGRTFGAPVPATGKMVEEV